MGALTYYIQHTPDAQRVPTNMRVKDDPAPAAVHPNSTPPATGGIKIKVVDFVGDEPSLTSRTISVPSGHDPMLAACDEVVKNANLSGVRLVGLELTTDHTAFLDFNPALEDGMGSMEEGLFIKGLQLALGQFPKVSTFRLRVEGKELDTLGHLELTDPIKVIR